MTDSCTIREPSTVAYNPGTRLNDETPGQVVYAGKCRTKAGSTGDRESDAGEAQVSTWDVVVSIPFAATHEGQPARVAPGYLVTIDAVGDGGDATLVGQRVTVRQVPQGTHLTARRLGCEVYGG